MSSAFVMSFNFFIVHQIEVLYQFWIHTELIRKLPRPIEYIFTTPSHHRVHHSVNEKYIDKNYGSTFIIWDRMFGTFQEEEETPRYGITKPVNSFNPFYLVFHEWIEVGKDILKAKSLKEAWTILFGNPVDKHKEDMGFTSSEDLKNIGKVNESLESEPKEATLEPVKSEYQNEKVAEKKAV